MKETYKKLASISIKGKTERKGNLDYLSWANAWHLLKLEYPTAQRNMYENEHTGLNYFTDGKTGYVKVGVDVEGIEHIDYLPIMDFRNKSVMVDNITSFDVNKTIQRATAKAIAMHGLGLSLWTGEDVPEMVTAPIETKQHSLEIPSENWSRVLKYIASNKELGLDKIVDQLGKKYKVTTKVKNAIKKEL
jgi:hypothetical protein